MATIDTYLERALDQLHARMTKDPDNLHLNICARKVRITSHYLLV